MTAKEYLNQARELDGLIRAKHAQIDMLKDRAERTRANMSPLKTTGGSAFNPMADAVDKYIDLQAELAQDIKRFHELQREIASVIKAVRPAKYRELLEYRYLSYLSWEDIAAKMGYTERHITRMHGRALLRVEDVL